MNSTRAKVALKIAKAIAKEQDSPGSAECGNETSDFDRLITESELREVCGDLYLDGHLSQCVLEAYKCLNNYVKDKAGLPNEDGSGLMQKAFSENNPVLKLNRLASVSQRDMQKGYLQIYAGCMTGIRNPRAHEHNYKDEARAALELLVWANHLLRLAKVARRRRKKPATPP